MTCRARALAFQIYRNAFIISSGLVFYIFDCQSLFKMKKILFDLFKNRKKHSQGDSKVVFVAANAIAIIAALENVQTIKIVSIFRFQIERTDLVFMLEKIMKSTSFAKMSHACDPHGFHH